MKTNQNVTSVTHGTNWIPRPSSALLTVIACLLLLSTRSWASTFTVVNTSDAGPGSLRQAILDANANPGLDAIEFAIGGGGPQMIVLQSALPAISQSVVIDGTTQPLFSSSPLITIDAAGVGTGLFLHGVANSPVRAITIENAQNTAIQLSGVTQSLIQDVSASWTGPGQSGIGVYLDSSSGNTVERVNSPNRQIGIYVAPGNSNLIQNNSLSGAVTGISALGLGNKFFNNDLSFASFFAIGVAQDPQLEISGNNFSHSANGLSLYDIDGLVASPNPGPGQISIDVSTVPGVALQIQSIRNSHFSDLVLSWNGQNLGNKGIYVVNSPQTTISGFVVKNRETGIALASEHVVVECSSIQNNQVGIQLHTEPIGVIVRQSQIEANSAAGLAGISSPTVLLAENNYWGAANGPAPIGSGNSFSGNVDVNPFLSAPPACLGGVDQEAPVIACLSPVTVSFGSVPTAATSAAQFVAQGGSISEAGDPNPSVTSLDALTGFCPILLTRT